MRPALCSALRRRLRLSPTSHRDHRQEQRANCRPRRFVQRHRVRATPHAAAGPLGEVAVPSVKLVAISCSRRISAFDTRLAMAFLSSCPPHPCSGGSTATVPGSRSRRNQPLSGGAGCVTCPRASGPMHAWTAHPPQTTEQSPSGSPRTHRRFCRPTYGTNAATTSERS